MADRRSTAQDLAQIAVFAALIAALGIPGKIFLAGGGLVPITFQTLGVMLAGAILGARKGFLAVLLFDALTFAGLPLLAGGRGGPSHFFSTPSAGYPWGFLVGALLIGYFTQKILPKYPLLPAFVLTAIGGIVAIYAVGIPVTAINGDVSLWAAAAKSATTIPGDLIKVVVTVLVARQVHRAYPGLMGRRVVSARTVPAPAPRA